jgi:hypothetical protein
MAKKYLLVLCILLFTVLRVFSQSNCEPNKFKELISYTKKSTLTSSEFLNSLEVLKNLESNHCGDFIVRKHGVDSVIASLTSLFGRICLIYNTQEAVKEYLRYMQRHQGSAEED